MMIEPVNSLQVCTKERLGINFKDAPLSSWAVRASFVRFLAPLDGQ